MKTATLIGVTFATACLAGACGKGREAQTSAARESSDRPQAGGTVSQPARFTGAAGAGGPLFSASVQSENADQAEAILKGTYAMIGAGTPGGKLEPVEGLGDRA